MNKTGYLLTRCFRILANSATREILFGALLLGSSFLLNGCSRDPGVVPDATMTEEEMKENERVGQVP